MLHETETAEKRGERELSVREPTMGGVSHALEKVLLLVKKKKFKTPINHPDQFTLVVPEKHFV